MSGVRRILITGGAKRVGAALGEGLAGPGTTIIVHYNASAAPAEAQVARLREKGAQAQAVQGDLSDVEACRRVVAEAAKAAGGPLTGLINSASAYAFDAPGAFDAAVFEQSMAVNLRAPVVLTDAFAAQTDAAANNCVVNMLDQKLWNQNPDFYSYTLAKQGLLTATTLAAMALAPRVRVNAIAPGLLLPSYGQSREAFEEEASLNLFGRPIDLAEIIRAAEYLMGSTALTGQVMHVDNGHRLKAMDREVVFLSQEAKSGDEA